MKKLLLLLILLMPSMSFAEIKVPIDLAIVCNENTPPTDRMFVEGDTVVAGYDKETCVEKNSYIKGVTINKISLRYAESIDEYALFLYTDMTMNKVISETTRRNVGRNIAIIKNSKLVIFMMNNLPVTEGIIPIMVPSKKVGELIGNDIGGKEGRDVTNGLGSRIKGDGDN
jgi:hypothetical protein